MTLVFGRPGRCQRWSQSVAAHRPRLPRAAWLAAFFLLFVADAGGAALATPDEAESTNTPAWHFPVSAYRIEGDPLLVTNAPAESSLAGFTGPNLGLTELKQAAAAVQTHYETHGWSNVVVTIGERRIHDGIVPISVFRGQLAQIVISGRRYAIGAGAVPLPGEVTTGPGTNAAPASAGPGFNVRAYEIRGNTLLDVDTLTDILTNYVGTNITVPEIVKAAAALQKEYRERAFPTVNVTLPPQQITNGLVKIRVFEGRLSEINVIKNHYFSSNNVMRNLPGLRPGLLLNSRTFQAELDRANANQDRQIYPRLEPGAVEGTTALRLRVEDRLPLHGKLELNNQSSPGTPDLRVNASGVYNNLWQLEHSLGLQYSFSPQDYKTGDRWSFPDKPLVANYSAFYRLPLGSQPSVQEQISNHPFTFGFDEATRKFNLPAPSGRAEWNLFASRSTIDTGLLTLTDETIQNIPGFLTIAKKDFQKDLTVNQDAGTRLTIPGPATASFHSSFSLGGDYKTYDLTSNKTNNFIVEVITLAENGLPNPPTISTVASPVPTTHRTLDYAPVSLRYDATMRDSWGSTAFGLGVNANTWFSGSEAEMRAITGSKKSSGYWVTVTPNLTRDFVFHTNWTLTLRADGQWANEPLISNEQFGAGGISSVRGYQQGEVFGDTGWHVSLEQKTPAHVVGMLGGSQPLTLRGSVYVDYAATYLLDPQGRDGRVPLLGAGFGGVISAGSHWEARFLFSLPFLDTANTPAYAPRFDFGLTAQF